MDNIHCFFNFKYCTYLHNISILRDMCEVTEAVMNIHQGHTMYKQMFLFNLIN